MKKKPYICPKCHSEEVHAWDSFLDDDSLTIEYECSDCGATWVEYFTVTYTGYSD